MDIERGLARTFAGHIHYRALGAGPAIVLTHINQQSSAVMVELMRALAPGFRVVAIDYPSHGHSDHIDWQPAIADYARCAVETLDFLGIDAFHAMGEAVGAAVSIELGAAHPDRCRRIVPVNTPFFADDATAARDIADIARVRPSDPSGFPAARTIEYLLANDPEHAPVAPTQSWMDRINVAQLEIGRDRWQAMGALRKFDTLGRFAAVRCPALMLYGENFIYGAHRDKLLARNPAARAEIVPGARFCMTWERADEVAARAAAFLR
ncbi:MAG: alpha/beta fold hydrolase [Rhodospirillales bacterium]|nr:MAG: alpha/beta fold hydrolase [Rhodospirillales bacterium]